MEKTEKERSAFVLGLAHGGLAIARDLGRKGIKVVGFSQDSMNPGNFSRYCKTVICPDVLTNPEGLLQMLLHEAENSSKRPVLFPTSDEHVQFILKNRELLERHFELPVAEATVIEKLVDKFKLSKIAEKAGVPCPKTFIAKNEKELAAAAEKIGFPFLAKPVYHLDWKSKESMLPEKAIQVNCKAELKNVLRALKKSERVLAQEIIPGSVSNIVPYGAYFGKNRKPLVEFSKRLIEEFPSPYGSGAIVETVMDERVLELGRKLLETANYFGPAEVEFKKDARTREIKLIEVNARVWTYHQLSSYCCDSVALAAFKELDGTLEKNDLPKRQNGRVVWVTEEEVLFQLLKRIVKRNLPIKKALRAFRGKMVFNVLAFDDPLPGMVLLIKLPMLVTKWAFLFLAKRARGNGG